MNGISLKMKVVKEWAAKAELGVDSNSAIYVLKEYVKANWDLRWTCDDTGEHFITVPTLESACGANLRYTLSDDDWVHIDTFELGDFDDTELPDTTCVVMYRDYRARGKWYTYTDVEGRVTVPVTGIRQAAITLKKFVPGRVEVRAVVNAS